MVVDIGVVLDVADVAVVIVMVMADANVAYATSAETMVMWKQYQPIATL